VKTPRPAVRLSLPSETRFLGLLRDVTRKMAELSGFEEKTASEVALAVDEAASNVLEHAYQGSADRVVMVEMDDAGEAFCVDVRDDGQAFDRSARPTLDVRHLEKERRTGGLGVHLMERIMDEVSFERRPPWNACCLVKRKRPAR
jgi:serine/threonine-protein kinase RsbW